MKLRLIGHSDRYPVEQLQMQLFPNEPSEFTQTPFSGDGAVSALHAGGTWLTATATITLHGKTARAAKRLRADAESVRLRRRILQQSYYLAAVQLLGAAPPWGALAGVRPTKLSTAFLLEGGTERACDRMLRDVYFISPARRRLCLDASKYTVEAAKLLRPRDLSLYIGIPFCPTRCAYCSFVSQSVEQFGKFLPPYLGALEREIAETGKLLRRSGYTVRTLYLGGGTPTTLSAAQIARLLDAVRASFDLSECLEITVEGGRPDTLDAEKLRAIAACGVGRMSINPQTMQDEILRRIGRRHTSAQTVQAYRDARAAGFRSLNMDLIAGLPGDAPDRFLRSLSQIVDLAPENITVHTLALKKSADLFCDRGGLPTGEDVARMLDGANERLREAGYAPYYLYRQKYTSGSFENVGWCKPGHEGRYNIYMMEELHSILALGGGGMNKVNLAPNELERFHNPKYPQDYIEHIDDVLEKKRQIFRLLEEL
ncbi:MAG: coproporphyrinogen dehydrogenase HemZ [Oscillospiraceae bacterium]|nr:coproporphyrinogen dehydrogenase HemZ [Oscillospiraceae bacterium]